MEENKKSEGRELEDLLKEGDEIAKRLGPEVCNKFIEIGKSSGKYVDISMLLGGLIAGTMGYLYIPKEYLSGENAILTLLSGSVFAGFPGMWIADKMKERAYRRLQKEFPDKIEDIKRLRDLHNTYAYSQLASHPIG